MKTTQANLIVFRGTRMEVDAADNVDMALYFAHDTREFFVGNALGKREPKTIYAGSDLYRAFIEKNNEEVLAQLEKYKEQCESYSEETLTLSKQLEKINSKIADFEDRFESQNGGSNALSLPSLMTMSEQPVTISTMSVEPVIQQVIVEKEKEVITKTIKVAVGDLSGKNLNFTEYNFSENGTYINVEIVSSLAAYVWFDGEARITVDGFRFPTQLVQNADGKFLYRSNALINGKIEMSVR